MLCGDKLMPEVVGPGLHRDCFAAPPSLCTTTTFSTEPRLSEEGPVYRLA